MPSLRRICGKYILEKITPMGEAAVYRTTNTNPPILLKYLDDHKWIFTVEGSDEVLGKTQNVNSAHKALPDILARLNAERPERPERPERAEYDEHDLLDLRNLDPPSPEP